MGVPIANAVKSRRWRDGAGEVLGESQLGEIHEVGFALYTNMLDAAVKALEDGKAVPDLTAPLSVNFKLADQDKLTWQKATGTLKERAGAVKELFKRLKPRTSAGDPDREPSQRHVRR